MKKLLTMVLVTVLIAASINYVPVVAEASEIELPDGGSPYWQHYNKVFGRTSLGANGRAEVTCQLSVFDNGGYSTAYNYVSVNVAYATVSLRLWLGYHSVLENLDRTISDSIISYNMGTSYSKNLSISNQNDYNSNGQQNYIGAKAKNNVSYTNYGYWSSMNYIGTWFN